MGAIPGIGVVGKPGVVNTKGKYVYCNFANGGFSSYMSSNFGASFTTITTPMGVRYGQFSGVSSDGKCVASVIISSYWGSGVYISRDYGSTWTRTLVLADDTTPRYAMSADGKYHTVYWITYGTYASGFYISSDYGATWTAKAGIGFASGGEGCISLSGQYQYFVSPGGSAPYSNNYGATWTMKSSPAGYSVQCSDLGDKLVIGRGGGGNILYSTNYGAAWSTFTTAAEWDQSCVVGISGDGTTAIAALTRSGSDGTSKAYNSTNGLASFTALGTVATMFPEDIVISKDGNIAYSNSSSYGLYKTLNKGASWSYVMNDGSAQGGLCISPG